MLANRLRFILLAILVFSLVGCQPAATAADPAADGALKVTVSIGPQAYLVRQLAGELASVSVMVPAGADVHTFEPSPRQMRSLADADLYLTIGEHFETVWMDRFLEINPQMRVVDISEGIERIPVAQGVQHTEEHADGEHADGVHADEEHADEEHADEVHSEDEHGDAHDHGGLDPHIWLSPRLMKQLAEATRAALAEADPAHAEHYATACAGLLNEIDTLDAEIRATLEPLPRQRFLVFHPSWGYFARDYGLEQISIEVDGQEPSAAELAQVIALARAEGIRVVIAQPEFSTRSAETIAQEIDGEVLLASPLAEDWMDNMRRVTETFARALEQ
ncbi:MAG: metal ABC transporter solute-binding protein, Zn/Mn family [Anaerolineae bacterium]|jgi:zinc transport system substrate-binding protein|nr:zinc ABC transporter solute-binding protein [Chloroflexota bacterium]